MGANGLRSYRARLCQRPFIGESEAMDLRDFQNRQIGPEDFFAMARKYLPQIGIFLVVAVLLVATSSMLYRIDASD